LGVTLTPDNLKTCHFTPSIALVFWLCDLKYSSKFDYMVRAIQSERNREFNVYFNVMLTRRRTNLLYHVRMLKKSDALSRFYSDNDGSITVVQSKGGPRVRLTDVFNSETRKFSTITVVELTARFATRRGA
jgi:hypothetical protein